ncbi:ROK family transcriptional regulator [Nitrospirillum pindoramense]|uniref:Transcriptional regulator n=1 Tax=Nitrospirillum amazonense TaxID=28077 RepID=A0A560H462_9PROT|nr:ROK family transcriptional regulator [Nitrospirillum amazonense]TWB41086.1 transcriptional regulator [Nitrospirillum amazonense]
MDIVSTPAAAGRGAPATSVPEGFCSANERRLLRLIREKGPISRADLARETGLTLQSIVRLVAALMERDLVVGGPKVPSGPGQPSLPIEIARDAAFSVGVSIMDDALSAVVIDLSGRVRATHEELFDTADRGRVTRHLGSILKDLSGAGGFDRSRLVGVGVAIPGFFVDSRGAVNAPLVMNDWALTDLEAHLGAALELPVWIENDGSAAAAGESVYGAGQHHRSFAYIHIASGLGGGVVLDGKPWRGRNGNAGEFTGTLPPSTRPDRPTLRLLLDLVNAQPGTGRPFPSVGALVQAFDPEWPAVETWLARTGEGVSAILSAAAAVLDPDAIVIGGRIPPGLTLRLIERAHFYSVPVRDQDRRFPTLVASRTGGDSAALGAATLPFLHHFF